MLDVGQFAPPSFTFLQARRRIGQELGLCPSRMISWLCWLISTHPDYVITCSMPPGIHGAAVTDVLPSGSTTTGLTLKDLSRPS